MGQVFTIKFDFQDERHFAAVTVCNVQVDDPAYYVRLFNPELHKIIPGGRLRFSSTDIVLPYSAQHPLAKALFLSIKNAVFAYLMKKRQAEPGTLQNTESTDQFAEILS